MIGSHASVGFRALVVLIPLLGFAGCSDDASPPPGGSGAEPPGGSGAEPPGGSSEEETTDPETALKDEIWALHLRRTEAYRNRDWEVFFACSTPELQAVLLEGMYNLAFDSFRDAPEDPSGDIWAPARNLDQILIAHGAGHEVRIEYVYDRHSSERLRQASHWPSLYGKLFDYAVGNGQVFSRGADRSTLVAFGRTQGDEAIASFEELRDGTTQVSTARFVRTSDGWQVGVHR